MLAVTGTYDRKAKDLLRSSAHVIPPLPRQPVSPYGKTKLPLTLKE
jgi:hypothetical protein